MRSKVDLTMSLMASKSVESAMLGDGEDLLLAAVEQVASFVGVVVAELGDLVADPDELAQDAGLAHDLGVLAHVGRGRHDLDQGVHEGFAADALEHALLFEGRAQCDGVDLFAEGVHVADRAEDEAVGVAVEVVFDDELGRDGDGVGADDHRAEERLLGVEVVRLHVTTVALDDAGSHDAAPLCGAAGRRVTQERR